MYSYKPIYREELEKRKQQVINKRKQQNKNKCLNVYGEHGRKVQ